MRLLKQAMAVSGTVTMIAVMVAVFAPKTAHAVAAALVQIEPGTTTQVGQNEGQLVSLACEEGLSFCTAVNPEGVPNGEAYVVPTEYTLIVTDYEFFLTYAAGVYCTDALYNSSSSYTLASGGAVGDKDGFAVDHEHYASGIRVGSGVTIADEFAALSSGYAYVQGYLVPN